MSLPISISKNPEPVDGLLTLTRTAVGLGIGILMADKIKRPVRQIAAIALVSVGALAAVPYLLRFTLDRINRPESERGSRARLRSIRGDSGYSTEQDIY
jgi:Na+/serine symporter